MLNSCHIYYGEIAVQRYSRGDILCKERKRVIDKKKKEVRKGVMEVVVMVC